MICKQQPTNTRFGGYIYREGCHMLFPLWIWYAKREWRHYNNCRKMLRGGGRLRVSIVHAASLSGRQGSFCLREAFSMYSTRHNYHRVLYGLRQKQTFWRRSLPKSTWILVNIGFNKVDVLSTPRTLICSQSTLMFSTSSMKITCTCDK